MAWRPREARRASCFFSALAASDVESGPDPSLNGATPLDDAHSPSDVQYFVLRGEDCVPTSVGLGAQNAGP